MPIDVIRPTAAAAETNIGSNSKPCTTSKEEIRSATAGFGSSREINRNNSSSQTTGCGRRRLWRPATAAPAAAPAKRGTAAAAAECRRCGG
uniref:Uncharacterized protein n=1 Tax=Oryza sativa subsp. japonica TaxID=39947 RepID=Q6H8A8_ORYSJ|nr:hypothetical protein [Oryza sativa Japonica Group]